MNLMLSPALSNPRRLPLILGDAATLLIFALLGRRAHSMGSALDDIIGTALPFVIGWFLVAPFTGALGPRATRSTRQAALCAVLTWLIAFPLGLLIRIPLVGRVAHPSFMIVAGAFTLVTLVLWRVIFAEVSSARD
jgi:hypothetical protein